MNKEKIIRQAFEAGYRLGYSDSSNGVHIKLERVIERFMKSESYMVMESENEACSYLDSDVATHQ